MVWAAFHAERKLSLAFTSARMNFSEYQQVLETRLLPFLEQNNAQNWISQKNKAHVHASRSTKEFFRRNSVEVLDWPACFPDHNPLEKIWGHLVKKFMNITGRVRLSKSFDPQFDTHGMNFLSKHFKIILPRCHLVLLKLL
ncbi:unnamed protein product [Nippostrongylus brasiliensis]|uniref:DDE_3 domain-containing protein n=1 Tax=Nippostrongylus brasiliensis TaxID=27835 RepID=A0A0N4XMC7_NIPBR|nr:unnamed protein product [Nippostrongylus brasiliensis]